MTGRWIRRIWAPPIPVLVLLVLSLVEAARVMSGVVKNLTIKQALPAILVGVLVGWWLGKRRGLWIAIGFVLVIAAGWAGLFVIQGDLSQELIGLVRAGSASLWDKLLNYLNLRKNLVIDPIVLKFSWQDYSLTVGVRWFQLTGWLTGLYTGASRYDLQIADIFWSCLTWVGFLWAGVCLSKWNNVLLGLTPIGILLVGLINRSDSDASDILIFCGISLILMVVLSYQQWKEHWIRSRLDYAEDVVVEIGVISSMVIAMLLLGGFVLGQIPALNPKGIQKWASQFRQGQDFIPAEPLGLQTRPIATSVFNSIAAVGLPRQHLIGAGPELSERMVMVIDILSAPETGFERYYWRSNTYDIYTGKGWASSPLEERSQEAGTPLPQPKLPGQLQLEQQVRFTIQNEQQARQIWSHSEVFAAGELVAVDQKILAAWRPKPEDELGFDFFGAKISFGSYRALSRLVNVDETQLRQAGQNYPDWVVERYLQLPDNLSDRLLAFAERFKSDVISPYDRARMIEGYLRQFTYTLNLPAPPPDVDVVDYFLFDLKRGYCDYYASAMVVLARLNGLPARLVTGYASGTYDPINRRYFVTEADAHSWVEVFSPNFGWVTFEPTGGRDSLSYLVQDENLAGEGLTSPNPEWMKSFGGLGSLVRYLFLPGLLLTPVLLGLGLRWYGKYKKQRELPFNIIVRSYQFFYRLARPLAVGLSRMHTPSEFAAVVGRILIDSRIGELTKLYEDTVYSSRSPGQREAQKAKKVSRFLQKEVRLERMKMIIRRWKKKIP